MLFILFLELEPSSYKNIIIFLFYFFCGWTGRLLGWTVSNHKKKSAPENSKLRNLVSEVVPAKVSEMSFQKKNTRSVELETGNSFWKLG